MARYIKTITIRLTAEDYADVRKQAAAKHLDLSKYVRQTILDRPFEHPDLLREYQRLNYEINRIGNNINQIAYRHNANLFHPNDKRELLRLMHDVKQLMAEVRQAFRREYNGSHED